METKPKTIKKKLKPINLAGKQQNNTYTTAQNKPQNYTRKKKRSKT